MKYFINNFIVNFIFLNFYLNLAIISAQIDPNDDQTTKLIKNFYQSCANIGNPFQAKKFK